MVAPANPPPLLVSAPEYASAMVVGLIHCGWKVTIITIGSEPATFPF